MGKWEDIRLNNLKGSLLSTIAKKLEYECVRKKEKGRVGTALSFALPLAQQFQVLYAEKSIIQNSYLSFTLELYSPGGALDRWYLNPSEELN